MKNNKETAYTAKELATELKSLLAEAEAMISSSGSDHNPEAVGSLHSRFVEAQERLSDAYDGARERVIAGAKSVDAAIRENPYQTMAVALGVGVLVGVLIGRRTK
jgi:ElaB/YqjD/DUF883 family membrane-anchored ribosome-binding protein